MANLTFSESIDIIEEGDCVTFHVMSSIIALSLACGLIYIIFKPQKVFPGMIPLLVLGDSADATPMNICKKLVIADTFIWIFSILCVVFVLIFRVRARKIIVPCLTFLLPTSTAFSLESASELSEHGSIIFLMCMAATIVLIIACVRLSEVRLRRMVHADAFEELKTFWFRRFEANWFCRCPGVPYRGEYLSYWGHFKWLQYLRILISRGKAKSLIIFVASTSRTVFINFTSKDDTLQSCKTVYSFFKGTTEEYAFIIERFKPSHVVFSTAFPTKILESLVSYFPSVHFIQGAKHYSPNDFRMPPILPFYRGVNWLKRITDNTIMPTTLINLQHYVEDGECVYEKVLSTYQTVHQALQDDPWECACPHCNSTRTH